MPPSAFINLLLPAAQRVHREHGIPASVTIAQGALESGWGARAPGNNLFGIKADPAWKGKTVDIRTHEYVAGRRVDIVAKFRAYASIDDCIADRARFLKANPRYAPCFREVTGEAWARALQKAGYATDPKYAESLIAVMRGRNMSQYDNLKGKP
ncbi:glycoside hydrolase family 73 protein [Massilia sp. YIM B02443]|uniref:glycoside hydrolase family 73 protein n=1 Tax=Massilia sp. YIM B02443 TaxID=3050127 RepID=UPI0025B6B4EA|nr:glycoside hydrolase family 73 protein [Massilia sp. YIM B02443]MDN4036808.1 glycoside hydrolase family 73 protein [Massilia sp. YIM B02443]